ncbi:TetR/AcrR family transcriptional regulator [Kutzneria sp. NPDC052558]|uniref:TetR/AcrR family transcriptional regulator n=1 Tax=Kutzneria sp. NPDC052558 TaxID=3364121 RepID=UPI0037CA8B22
MPKIVDHEARRREIADALWRITRRDGWEAITLRGVAAEAGVSMGLVQHYFRSKDEMLRFALEIIVDDVRAELRRVVAALPEPRTPRQLVTAVMMELVPRDRPNEAETAAVFMRRLQLRPESLARLGAGQPDLRELLAEQIRLARPDTDADLAADGLIALLEGLIFVVVTGQQSSATARKVMAAQLDHVFN